LGEIRFKKCKKRREGSKVFIEPLGGVVIFLRSGETFGMYPAFDKINSRPLKCMVKMFLHGLPKIP
jgi:hypothetical protein